VIAYAACINHGLKAGMGRSISEAKRAVEAGYWHLWRYNPQLLAKGKNPFILDSEEPEESFRDFLMGEVRYASLGRTRRRWQTVCLPRPSRMPKTATPSTGVWLESKGNKPGIYRAETKQAGATVVHSGLSICVRH
jgi:hypothetical protein